MIVSGGKFSLGLLYVTIDLGAVLLEETNVANAAKDRVADARLSLEQQRLHRHPELLDRQTLENPPDVVASINASHAVKRGADRWEMRRKDAVRRTFEAHVLTRGDRLPPLHVHRKEGSKTPERSSAVARTKIGQIEVQRSRGVRIGQNDRR